MARLFALLTVWALLVGVAHGQGGPAQEAVRHNERGAALLKQGKLEEAATAFQQAAQADPDNVAVRMNLAYIYDRQGRSDDAITEYRKVLERDPDHSLARNNLGVLYDRQGRHDEAIRELEQVLQGDPPDASAVKNLDAAKRNRAIVREREQQLTRAVQDFETRPDDARAAYGVARLYAVHGQTDQALTWLAKALALGLEDLKFVTADPALVSLRKDPRFMTLVEGQSGPSEQPR